mgnify:CR=1 FL=1
MTRDRMIHLLSQHFGSIIGYDRKGSADNPIWQDGKLRFVVEGDLVTRYYRETWVEPGKSSRYHSSEWQLRVEEPLEALTLRIVALQPRLLDTERGRTITEEILEEMNEELKPE